MSHHLVIRAAEKLVAEAEALHPNDRVKQCTHLVGRRGRWTNAYALAENDVAFDPMPTFAEFVGGVNADTADDMEAAA